MAQISYISWTSYGPEGNRTPVRKPIPYGISHHSLYFNIPSVRRLKTNSGFQ